MKELSIEDKTKRYDEAVKKLKVLHDDWAESQNRAAKEVEEIFPELKESEDETIRKSLIEFVKSRLAGFDQGDKFIAWLEKQGEQKSAEELIQQEAMDIAVAKCFEQGEQKPNNQFTPEQANILDKHIDKFLEQKSIDKAEPKFKVGDWVVSPNGVYWHIDAIQNGRYEVIAATGQCSNWPLDTNLYRLWTIQDAKDGDVLSYRDGQWIFIYKEKIDDSSFCYHALYSTIHQDLTINDAGFTLLDNAIIPATKEQRDLLFQKMKEAGYEWDAEKKELSKIKQKPADKVKPKFKIGDKIIEKAFDECGCGTIIDIKDGKYLLDDGSSICIEEQGLWKLVEQKSAWSEEDEQYLLVCKNALAKYQTTDKWDATIISRWLEDKLKLLKDKIQPQPKQEWKQENTDDLTDFENAMMHIGGSFFGENAGLDTNDTNAIKEQANLLLELVPKQEWSEEDKEMLDFAIRAIGLCRQYAINNQINGYSKLPDVPKKFEELQNWLKSKLCPQPHWKPSDEQMNALQYVYRNCNPLPSDKLGWDSIRTLELMYQDLKKLKE